MKKALYPFLITILLAAPLLLIDKADFSWFVNQNHQTHWDYFFKYSTFLGDGILIAVVFLMLLTQKRKYIFAFIISFLVHLICVHVFKQWLCNGMWRPAVLFENEFPERVLHFVEGVKVRRYNTFPSGHTTTAFYLASFVALFFNKRFVTYALIVLALIAGFSRIYLMQHFYPDVFAGMIFGLFSTYLGYMSISKNKKWHNSSFFTEKFMLR